MKEGGEGKWKLTLIVPKKIDFGGVFNYRFFHGGTTHDSVCFDIPGRKTRVSAATQGGRREKPRWVVVVFCGE